MVQAWRLQFIEHGQRHVGSWGERHGLGGHGGLFVRPGRGGDFLNVVASYGGIDAIDPGVCTARGGSTEAIWRPCRAVAGAARTPTGAALGWRLLGGRIDPGGSGNWRPNGSRANSPVNVPAPRRLPGQPRRHPLPRASDSESSTCNDRFSFEGTHHQKLNAVRHPEKAKPTGKKLRAKDWPWPTTSCPGKRSTKCCAPGSTTSSGCWSLAGASPSGAATRTSPTTRPVLKPTDLYFSKKIIWVKEHAVLTRMDFTGWPCGAGRTCVETGKDLVILLSK